MITRNNAVLSLTKVTLIISSTSGYTEIIPMSSLTVDNQFSGTRDLSCSVLNNAHILSLIV